MLGKNRAAPARLAAHQELFQDNTVAFFVLVEEQAVREADALRPERLLKKVDDVALPAKFAVGHRLEPDRFLHRYDVADRRVLDGAQVCVGHLTGAMTLARFDDPRRAQHAANLIGAKRGIECGHGGSANSSAADVYTGGIALIAN